MVRHLRSNLIAYVALFLALSGGSFAVAALNRHDKRVIKKIVNKQITRRAPGLSVNQAHSADEATHAGTAGSAQTVAGIPPSEIGGKGRSADEGSSSCNDDDGNGQDCVSVGLDLSRTQRVLVVADGEWSTPNFDDGAVGSNPNLVHGRCRVILTPGGEQITEARMGEFKVATGAVPVYTAVDTAGSYAMNAVTEPLASGSYTFTVNCIEDDGDIDFHRGRISVVALGSG